MKDPDGCWNGIGCLVVIGALTVISLGLYVCFIAGSWAVTQITG